MKDLIVANEHKHIDFGFLRFFNRKYAFIVDTRNYTSTYSGSLHNHDFPQIWYCLDGHYFHRVDEQIYECSKGSVVIIPTGVFHKLFICEGEDAVIQSLSVSYDFFQAHHFNCFPNAITNLYLTQFFLETGYIFSMNHILSLQSQAIFEDCISCLSILEYNHSTVCSELIFQKLEEIFSLPEFMLPKEYFQAAEKLVYNIVNPVTQMLIYINSQWPFKINEDTLICTSGICRAYAYRYFKRYTGYTYSQYLQRLRARHACLYLGHTVYPLTYISDMCGFYDTHHMNRVFKKYIGCSPNTFRINKQKWLEKNPNQKLHII